MDDELNDDDKLEPEGEIAELMLAHDLDEETAEKVQELIDEGLDEDEALEIAEEL